MRRQTKKVGELLATGAIIVMPSDTVYGIFTSALIPDSIEKVYQLRKRRKDKPMIILISSKKDLSNFGIQINEKTLQFLDSLWPGPFSVVFPCPNEEFSYLHRGSKSLAFRVPNDQYLLSILQTSGPLVAPSANFEGEPQSKNINEAIEYFKENIDLYIDGGNINKNPSTIIEINNDKIIVLRQGAGQLPGR